MTKITSVYYQIRFPKKSGTGSEFYSSNSGTDRWYDISRVKALITRGRPYGYRGIIPFEDYEIVEVTEKIQRTQKTIHLSLNPQRTAP